MRSTELFLASIAALSGTALIGCGPSTTPADAFTPSAEDAPVPGADSPAAMTPRVVVGTRAMNMPADTECLGANTAPMPGADVAGTLEFEALALSPFPVAMGDVEIYEGAVIGAPGSGTAGTTDAMGQLAVTLPSGGWFGYRMDAAGMGATSSVPVLGQFYPWTDTAGSTVTVTAISASVADIIAGQLNRELAADRSAVSGSVRDCDFTEVANVQIRFFRGETEIVSGPADDTMSPRITGLGDGAIPSPNASGLTGYLGRFAGIVPSAGGSVRIEAWGVTSDGGTPELVGCEDVLVEGGSVTVAVIPALRSDADYGSGHSCVGRGE